MLGTVDGDAAAAAADDDVAAVAEGADGAQLHDPPGPWGRHHPAVAPPRVLNKGKSPLGADLFRLLTGVKIPNGFGGM